MESFATSISEDEWDKVMSKRKTKPKIIYGNAVNLSGLYNKSPMRLKWNEELEGYWDSFGDFEVDNVGEVARDGFIAFASVSKQDVENWTRGALAVMKMLNSWSS